MGDSTGYDDLGGALEQWQAKVEKGLAKNPERKPAFVNTSEIPVKKTLYASDVKDLDYLTEVGFPRRVSLYPGRPADHVPGPPLDHAPVRRASPPPRNPTERYKYLLEQGQTGLSVAFDLPTQIGYDSDHPMAQGEVGKVGVAIDSLKDMETLFDRHPPGQGVHLHDHQRPGGHPAGHVHRRGREAGGRPAAKLRGTIQNDILKEYSRAGTYIFPPSPPCASSPTSSSTARTRCPSGTPSASAATTSGRRAPRPSRRWPSPWPTASPMWRPR